NSTTSTFGVCSSTTVRPAIPDHASSSNSAALGRIASSAWPCHTNAAGEMSRYTVAANTPIARARSSNHVSSSSPHNSAMPQRASTNNRSEATLAASRTQPSAAARTPRRAPGGSCLTTNTTTAASSTSAASHHKNDAETSVENGGATQNTNLAT